uniref:EF-hand domain-containing protein n=1 Tax=Prolemur simus TaxID=1328070 RepID=A0A8C9AFI1_PROSS
MSNTEAETMLMGLVNLYHKYTQDSDAVDKAGLEKMMKENFPSFPSACSPDFLDKFFKKEDRNHDEKINFSEFLSSVVTVAVDLHDQSHGQKPCSVGQR